MGRTQEMTYPPRTSLFATGGALRDEQELIARLIALRPRASVLGGKVAFALRTTHGLPLAILVMLAYKRRFWIDWDEGVDCLQK